MTRNVGDLIAAIKTLEQDLEAELAKRRVDLKFGLEEGRIRFDAEILRLHRQARIGIWSFLRRAELLVLLTAPFIFSLIVPLVLLDLFVSLYQAVCFPVYGLVKVRRRDYIVFDRHHLAYLNIIQKVNCGYCSYANGLLAYVREIAARTEQHWCPIKHAGRLQGTHPYYPEFADFGDAEAFSKAIAAPGPKNATDLPKTS